MHRIARVALIALATLTLLFAIRQTWAQHHQAGGLDFYIYWVNSQLPGREDVDDIYSAETQRRIGEEYYASGSASGSELLRYDSRRRRQLDNVSSPFLYTALRWVSRDYQQARTQFLVAVIVAFLAGTMLLCRGVGLSWTVTCFLAAALLVWYGGFEADLRVGNVNSLQLLALGIIVWLEAQSRSRSRGQDALRFLAAATAGMLLMFKPNLLYAVLLVFAARAIAGQWRELRVEMAGGAVGALGAVAIAAINYGSVRVWLQWPAAASQFWQRLQPRGDRNVAPALELFQRHGSWISHAIALGLILLVCVALRMGRSPRVNMLLVASTGILIYLLASTVVWLHYMVLALPSAIALMRWRHTALVAFLSLAVIAEKPYLRLSGTAIYPYEAETIGAALLVLFACSLWKLARAGLKD